MTREEYRDFFWVLIQEPNGANDDFLTTAQLNLLIEDGREEYWRTLVESDEDNSTGESTESLSVVTGTSSYALPDDCYQFKGLDYPTDDRTIQYMKDVKMDLSDNYFSDLQGWAIQGNNLIVKRPVNATLTQRYIRLITALEDDETDDPDIPTRDRKIPCLYAAWQAFMMEGTSSAQFWEARYEKAMSNLKVAGGKRSIDSDFADGDF